MKKIGVFTTILSLLFVGCIEQEGPSAKVDDLMLMGGIENRRLLLDGTEGISSTFTFRANHDWKIIDYKGFLCEPSSGEKTVEREVATITATPLRSNNSADTIRLSALNFKMLSTRFVGISAYQLPQIRLPKGDVVYIDAVANATTSTMLVSHAKDIELDVKGEISAVLGAKNQRGEHTITIKCLESNNSTTERVLGSIGFIVDGVAQESEIEIRQISAIEFDRNIVLLPGKAGASNMLSVNSKFDVSVSSNSSLFTTQSLGDNKFLITATNNSDSEEEKLLGTIDAYLTDAPDCRIAIEVYQRQAIAPQTIVVHFVGTALGHYFNGNISKMLEALNNNTQGASRVVVVTTDSTTDATLYELRYDKFLNKAVKEQVKELSLSTPYNAAQLTSILGEALAFAPAEQYALIIGAHGHGWTPKNFTSTSQQLRKMGMVDLSLLWQKPEGGLTRHIGDNGYTVQYDISEIATAIESNNIQLEYLLFDSCFMGNIETAYELRNATKYIVGSPCEVMGAGFPYDKVMPYMLTDGGRSYNLDKVCSEYVEHYRNGSGVGIRSACVALTHTAELEALAAAVKAVNNAPIKSNFSIDKVQIYDGLNSAYNPVHTFYDLGDLVEQSCDDAEVVATFKTQLSKCVTSKYHTDTFFSDYDGKYYTINYYSGITTSAMVDLCSDMWQQTAWYKATH